MQIASQVQFFLQYQEVPIRVHINVKSSCRDLVYLHSLLQGVGDDQGVVGQECQRGGGGGRLISDLEWREDCLLFCRGE